MEDQDTLPVVFEKDGEVFANTRDVADYFEKRHADVLRAVNNIKSRIESDFSERNFALAEYKDAQGKPRKSYNMTQEGFSFVVFGFTGKNADAFKVAYINQFKAMREELQKVHKSEPL